MKRILITLVFIFVCMTTFAETLRFRSTDIAVGQRNNSGKVVWGEWQTCKVIITIDLDNDFIKVYSDKEQNYVIVESIDSYKDKSGGNSLDFKAIDEEGIECTVRLRIESDGRAQLYAFYSNIAWVYGGLTSL